MSFLSELFSAGVWGKEAPAAPLWKKWIHRNLSEKHCEECLMLDECWFFGEKTPVWPHHPFCHCVLEDVPYNDVLTKSTSDSDYSKFDIYLFNTEGRYTDTKKYLFESWGYTMKDGKWLQSEIEKQGLENYISGAYETGLLDEYGQRISIRVKIPRKDQEDTVSFITGWMVRPEGHIQLATPYGGK